MKPLAQILQSKTDQTVYTIAPSATVLDAIRLMAEKGIGALVVTEGEKVIGMVSERDYSRKVILQGRASRDTPVQEIMTSPAVHVRPEQTNEECMALMTESRQRHFPVLDEGRLIGVVSIGDLVKDIISEQRFIIDQLEHYISGDRG